MQDTEQIEANESKPGALVVVPASFALAACGGGGGSNEPAGPIGSPAPAPTPSKPAIALAEASRFLAQATNGATRADIDRVAAIGFEDWLDQQFATARTITLFDRMEAKGYDNATQMFALGNWDTALWHGLLTGSDALRQRVTLALLDIFTIGIATLPSHWRSFSLANHFDVLADNAFGSFRDLLEAVTFSTASASFLTYLGSRKANGTGARPDENYAREIMQLFTIGLHALEEDGSLKRDANGRTIATYSQADIAELARVFTGLKLDGAREDHSLHRRRLLLDPAHNDSGIVNFMGHQISGGGTAAIGRALDIIIAHSNTGPFVARRLIQSLVSSNPSPGYIRRVSRIFADNGHGERGDLRAVIRAILLDSEARSGPSEGSGRLRDPVQRFINWAKAFKVRDRGDSYRVPNLLAATGKAPGWSPTVFNFHQYDFTPRKSSIGDVGMVAPEFQIVSEQTTLGYANFMWRAVAGFFGYAGLDPDLSPFLPLAADPAALVDELALVLAAGQLAPGTRAAIADGCNSISGSPEQRDPSRVRLATLMVLTAPEYLVLE